MPGLEFVCLVGDVTEHVGWGAAHVGGHGEPGEHAPLESCDPDHEELVEVGREDGQEVRAFERGDGRILRQFEDTLVEGQPAHLTVEVSPLGQGRVIPFEYRVEVVVVPAESGVERNAVSCHPNILSLRVAGRGQPW